MLIVELVTVYYVIVYHKSVMQCVCPTISKDKSLVHQNRQNYVGTLLLCTYQYEVPPPPVGSVGTTQVALIN